MKLTTFSNRIVLHTFAFLLLVTALPLKASADEKSSTPDDGYAVVVSEKTRADSEWKKVVDALVKKYDADVITWKEKVTESLDGLKKSFPRHVAFVATPEETPRRFVVDVHRMMRKMDDDPYTDAIWGIVTGYEAADALRIAKTNKPLEIRRAGAGTGILSLGPFDEGIKYSEGNAKTYFEKKPGGKEEKLECEQDTTEEMVKLLNDFKPEIFTTSGHATERDWQLGFSYRNGQFRCKDGTLVGIDTKRKVFPVNSPNPKVYLASGNCLMGHIKDRNSMAVAWIHSCGVRQMFGYTVSTWFGRGGWGTKNYFFDMPGRYTLSDSFFFNNNTIVHELKTKYPDAKDVSFERWDIERGQRVLVEMIIKLGYKKFGEKEKNHLGLLWDIDTVAFYGDPAWVARIAPKKLPLTTSWDVKDGEYTWTIKVTEKVKPSRPLAAMIPGRVKDIKILEGEKFKPLVTDNFIMLHETGELEPGEYKVRFKAKAVK